MNMSGLIVQFDSFFVKGMHKFMSKLIDAHFTNMAVNVYA